MAWVERIVPSDQDQQFESWRKEFQQERLLRIVREREIMKETAKRCKSYQIREQEANDALERKRQAILAQRKAATVQATMRFQRNLPGFTVMDPDKFDRAIETITGRQLTNRSTPRRMTAMQQQQQQQQRFQSNTTFRRSISMEDLGSRQPISNPHRIDQRNQTILTRTNSVTQVPQYINQIQYTSPLQEVQRRVLNDFAAQIQTTLHQPQHEQFDEINTWEHESIDSLEASTNHYHPQQIIAQSKITGPIVPSNRIVNIQSKKSNTSTFESTIPKNQQDLLSQSYHESFFVKNTPVTGEEQVTAWLGVNKTPTTSNKHVGIIEKPPSYDGNDPEINAKRKSILKRSPSADSNSTNSFMNTKPIRKATVSQARTVGDKVRVKDSLEVINAKLLKELDIQKKTVRFAQDSNNERCASDTQLVKQTDMDNEQTPLRRVQSAAMLTPLNRQPIKQTLANDDRASECSSTTSSKPPVYPLTPTSQTRTGYTNIGLKQRELRAKLHKTRYAQSLRQTNTSPTMYDSPSARHTSPQISMPITTMKTNELNNERRTNDDDENDSLFSELRMSSIPSSQFSQNDARLPPPVPSSKMIESKMNGTKNSALQTHTTLSIEERRVQESIDRLDRQLKEVQTRTRSTSGTRLQKNQKR